MKYKNTISQKNKFYELIGRATLGFALWALGVYGIYNLAIFVLDNCCTTLK